MNKAGRAFGPVASILLKNLAEQGPEMSLQPTTIAELLTRWKAELGGVSDEELARRLSAAAGRPVKQTTLSSWRGGRAVPLPIYDQALAAVLAEVDPSITRETVVAAMHTARRMQRDVTSQLAARVELLDASNRRALAELAAIRGEIDDLRRLVAEA